MPKRIDAAVKERALTMFADHRGDYHLDTALAEARLPRSSAWVAEPLDDGRLIQVDVNAGTRPGPRAMARPK